MVTPRSFGVDDPGLRRRLEDQVAQVHYRRGPLSAGELAEVIGEADGLIAGLDEVSSQVFAVAKRLRVVARYGVGTDRVDLEAAARQGVTVTVTPGANATRSPSSPLPLSSRWRGPLSMAASGSGLGNGPPCGVWSSPAAPSGWWALGGSGR